METSEKLNVTLLAKTVSGLTKDAIAKAVAPLIDRVATLEASVNSKQLSNTGDLVQFVKLSDQHLDSRLSHRLDELTDILKKQHKLILDRQLEIRRLEKTIAELKETLK